MKFIYNSLFKRTSTFAVVVMGSVFFFERAVNVISDEIFIAANKGKLWNDIKHKYE